MAGIAQYYENGYPGGPVDSDFREFYSLDLEEVFENDRWRAYGLIGNLPNESRTVRNSIGGEVLGYSDLMLAKIELMIRGYIWNMSDKNTRGPRPEIDVPNYMKDLNSKNLSQIGADDISNAYAWIYSDDFENAENAYK